MERLRESIILPIVVISVLIICGGWLMYEQYYGEQHCEMTWMYAWPQYKRIKLSEDTEQEYPRYSLHYYLESRHEVEPDLDHWELKLTGVPALFLPGNAGSHKQSRSSASIALKMHRAEFSSLNHFDFFTVNINEELSGMFGGVLQRQTAYVAKCIKHILSLYSNMETPPTSLAIIGHSMGGLVAQALYTLPESEFNKSSVTTLIALASPLKRPVLVFDHLIQQFYDNIHKEWSASEPGHTPNHATLVSIAGGERDIMIPTYLTVVPQAISIATPAVPRNWVSADHQAVVWCRRAQLALTRVLFHLLDVGSRELTAEKERREATASHFLKTGREIPIRGKKTDKRVAFDPAKMEFVESESQYFYREGYKSGVSRYAIPLDLQDNRTLVIASNTARSSWVYACSVDTGETANCTDISYMAALLPPKLAVAKYILLPPSQAKQLFEVGTHIVLSQPKDTKNTNGFVLFEECSDDEIQVFLEWQGTHITVPLKHCTLLKFSLPELTDIWQSYAAVITSSCGGVRAGLVTPWYPHTPLASSLPARNNITVELNVLVPAPQNSTPYLLVWSSHSCPLEVSISMNPLASFRRLAVFYAPLLLPWVTALCMAGSSGKLEWEILVVYVIYSFSRSGWSIGSDWEVWSGERLWCGLVPVIIHLIARGLQQFLSGMVYLFVKTVQWSLGRFLQPVSWVLLLASILCSIVCSGLGLLLLLCGFLMQVSSQQSLGVACVLVCLQLLLAPTLISWVKGLRFSMFLYPDPHFAAVLATCCVVVSMVYRHFQTRSTSRWLPTKNTAGFLEKTLALLLLLYGISHAYRMMHFTLAYLILTAIKSNHL